MEKRLLLSRPVCLFGGAVQPSHEDMTTVREYVKIAARDARDMYRSPLDAL